MRKWINRSNCRVHIWGWRLKIEGNYSIYNIYSILPRTVGSFVVGLLRGWAPSWLGQPVREGEYSWLGRNIYISSPLQRIYANSIRTTTDLRRLPWTSHSTACANHTRFLNSIITETLLPIFDAWIYISSVPTSIPTYVDRYDCILFGHSGAVICHKWT
jgi:hypothetical protein